MSGPIYVSESPVRAARLDADPIYVSEAAGGSLNKHPVYLRPYRRGLGLRYRNYGTTDIVEVEDRGHYHDGLVRPLHSIQYGYEPVEHEEPIIVLEDDGVVRQQAADEYIIAPDTPTAAELDAADGVFDGKFHGVDVCTQSGAHDTSAHSPSAADHATNGQPHLYREEHRISRAEAELEAENARLRGLILDLSKTFQDRFEELAARRDGDYLELQARYQTAAKQLQALSEARKRAPAPAAKPKKATAPAKVTPIPTSKPAASKHDDISVRVHVKEAVDLVMPEDAQPLVQLRLHNAMKQTKAHKPGPHPTWHELLTLVEPFNSGPRRLEVVLRTQYGEVGQATVELPSGVLQTDVWVPLTKAGEAAGSVHLGIEAHEFAKARAPIRSTHTTTAPRPQTASPIKRRILRESFVDSHMPIPSPNHPLTWDLAKLDGEKFWVCLVAKDGQLVLDPAEYKKAPALWAMSQSSTEAIFNAYNSSFQTAMRRKGLNKLNSYWQKEINDLKGIYLSHLDEHVGGPKAVALRSKEEQILALEKKLADVEASRDDQSAKLIESASLLKENAHQMQEMNAVMSAEVADMAETRRLREAQRPTDATELLGMLRDRRWVTQTEARVYGIERDTANPDDLIAEINVLRDELQEQRHTNTVLKERLEAVENNRVVHDLITRTPQSKNVGSPVSKGMRTPL